MRVHSAHLVLLVIALAASTAQKPSFEVASIKPNNSGPGQSSTSCCTGGYFKATNNTLRQLILNSYKLFDFQVIGGPDWMGTARFDIEARADMTANPEVDGNAMIQSLLEERFGLKARRETRELPVFMLVVAKGGSKLQETVEGRLGPGGLSAGSSRTNGGPAGGEMTGSGITIGRLIALLSSRVDRPIIDETNLPGRFDFTLRWSSPQVGAGVEPSNDSSAPDIFTAVQEQLGLKLEAGKGPIEVLVIDEARKPSEN